MNSPLMLARRFMDALQTFWPGLQVPSTLCPLFLSESNQSSHTSPFPTHSCGVLTTGTQGRPGGGHGDARNVRPHQQRARLHPRELHARRPPCFQFPSFLLSFSRTLSCHSRQDLKINWAQSPIRPEFAESTYFLYRATGDPIYLDVRVACHPLSITTCIAFRLPSPRFLLLHVRSEQEYWPA